MEKDKTYDMTANIVFMFCEKLMQGDLLSLQKSGDIVISNMGRTVFMRIEMVDERLHCTAPPTI